MNRPAAATAPGRVNLIGEHLDYNGGPCLPIALRQATTATVRPREDALLVLRSGTRTWRGPVADIAPGRVEGWAAYVAGVVWALGLSSGWDIEIAGDVPLGAGLSSSAALECSVAVALDHAAGLGLTREQLIAACIRAESEIVGAPTGGLDQTVSILAVEAHALLVDFRDGSTRQVPFDLAGAGLELLVVDTGVAHELAAGGGYRQRRTEAEEAAALLGLAYLAEASLDQAASLPDVLSRRARHVASETARVHECVAALQAGDWPQVGELFTASHRSLQHDYEASAVELDAVVDAALAAGALGARMTGGGFGGSAIVLASGPETTAVRAAIDAAFAARGWTAPAYLIAEAGPGARVGAAAAE